MSFQAEISRINPTCFLFLIDQSTSMFDPIMGVPGNRKKAEFVAEALNKVIQNLVVLASKDVEVRRYYQIGVIGYGSNVGPALGGNLTGQELVWVDDIYANPLRVEERMKKESDGAGGFIEVKTKFPVWFDPVANGNTPMCQALKLVSDILDKWVQEHKLSYPPTVINLTDGEATDGDPRPVAERLKSMSTSDGNVVLLTLHVSSNQSSQQNFFPNNTETLPDEPSKVMYEMSSPLTKQMMKTAEELLGKPLQEGAKGIVYNAEIAGVVQALDIGTRPANLR